MNRTVLNFGLGGLLARVLLGLFFVAVQASSPGEGAMILLLDVPTLATSFAFNFLTGWPKGITDAYDVTFHIFGLITWFAVGLLVGLVVAKFQARRERPNVR